MTLLILTTLGCNSKIEEVKKAYNTREKLILFFRGISLFRDNRDRIGVTLFTHNEKKNNLYVFKKGVRNFELIQAHISFSPDTILSEDTYASNRIFNEALITKIKTLTNLLDSLNIRSITSDFKEHGIVLKAYMKNGQVLLFVPHKEDVHNGQWRNYIESAKELDNHWYYLIKDK
jgi:hypothetical protein